MASKKSNNNNEDPPTSPSLPRTSSFGVQRLRKASISFMEQQATGFFTATASSAVTAPTIKDIQQESSESRPAARRTASGKSITPTILEEIDTIDPPSQLYSTRSRSEGPRKPSDNIMEEVIPELTETVPPSNVIGNGSDLDAKSTALAQKISVESSNEELVPIEDEPKLTKMQAFGKLMKNFWSFFCTIKGFLIVLYFLNIVAWGGMIFLLFCGAAPAMTKKYPGSDNRSAKKKWIEIDAQVLTGLFCVTGFGLLPWRLRDLILLMQFRLQHKQYAEDKLSFIHRSWFRKDDLGPLISTTELIGSHDVEKAAPRPVHREYNVRTRTGKRATATRLFWMDIVVWSNIFNTVFQAALCGFMWGYNRINRPTWATPLFIVLAFGCGILNGLIIWRQGARIKKVEGRALPSPMVVATEVSNDAQEKSKKKEGSWLGRRWRKFRAGTD